MWPNITSEIIKDCPLTITQRDSGLTYPRRVEITEMTRSPP